MTDRIDQAREAVRRAADVTDEAAVQKQLQSIDEALMEMTHSSADESSPTDSEDEDAAVKTEGDVPRGDHLQEVESKLAGLGDETEGEARTLVQDARDHLDAYRRQYTRDW